MDLKYISLSVIFTFTIALAQAQIYGEGLVINEFLASSDSLSDIADPNGQFEDWIELYNNGNLALNLENFSLTDKPDNPQKWVFPAGTTLEPGDYLIIWADEDGSQEGLHANFKLNKGGEFVMLSNPFGEVLDSLTFTEQETNIAFARRPNGTGDFKKQYPTFGYNNDEVNATAEILPPSSFILSPNPATSVLQISWKTERIARNARVEVFDQLGQSLWQSENIHFTTPLEIEVEGFSPGLYYVRIQTEMGWVTKPFITQ